MRAAPLVWLLFSATSECADPVRILSEFRRVGPNGEIVEADRGGTPREIISPALVRNGYTTLLVAVSGPKGRPLTLHLGDNPPGVVRATLYRVVPKPGVPDALERVGAVGTPVATLFPAETMLFALDIWTPGSALLRRVRLEVQYNSGGPDWTVLPMEMRVMEASLPPLVKVQGPVGAPAAPSSATGMRFAEAYLCGAALPHTPVATSIRSLQRRNAAQDLALAQSLEAKHGKVAVQDGMARAMGKADIAAFCASPKITDPEQYLKARDFLIRLASSGPPGAP